MLTSFRPPLYPAFLALIYLIGGVGVKRFFIARLVQVFLAASLAGEATGEVPHARRQLGGKLKIRAAQGGVEWRQPAGNSAGRGGERGGAVLVHPAEGTEGEHIR